MSNRRIPEYAGWSGRVSACRWCGGEIPNGRQTFCSAACVHEHKSRTDKNYQARCLLERDKGVCAVCGLNCVDLLARLKVLSRKGPHEKLTDLQNQLHIMANLIYRKRIWEVDHIVPVSEGGGGCGLEGLQTLCWYCHKTETQLLRQRSRAVRLLGSAGPGQPQAVRAAELLLGLKPVR